MSSWRGFLQQLPPQGFFSLSRLLGFFSLLGLLAAATSGTALTFLGVVVTLVGLASVAALSLGAWQRAEQRLQELSQEQARNQRLLTQVEELANVVGQASAGNLQARPSFQGDDGVGRLALGLGGLLDQLVEVVERLHSLGEELSSFSHNIASQTREQEQVASGQVSRTLNVLGHSQQINRVGEELVARMKDVAYSCAAAAQLAQESQNRNQKLRAILEEMIQATGHVVDDLAGLNERAQAVDVVMTTFVKIAHDTNLLALNAAIQAEHAGPFGAGFGVVAQEIRRVAERNSVSAIDIESTVLEMQQAAQSGWQSMQQFRSRIEKDSETVVEIGEILASVGLQVQELSPQFEQAVGAAETQSLGARQIVDQIRAITDMANQNARTVQRQNEALAQVQGIARELTQLIETLRGPLEIQV